MTLRIVLVRHGLSSYNLEHRIQGRDDLSCLTPEGVDQARSVGAALAELTLHSLYSSPLARVQSLRSFGCASLAHLLHPPFACSAAPHSLTPVDFGDFCFAFN